jgi:hypothetical protein
MTRACGTLETTLRSCLEDEEIVWKTVAKFVWQRRSNAFGGSASLMGR